MAPSCEVHLLGGFSVTVDDRPVSVDAWRSRRAADLVKLLALQSSHRLHREQVMDALWPDLSPEAAAANLRKAVHYARRAMGVEEAIATESGMLELWPHGALDVDFDRFSWDTDEALSSKSRDACALVVEKYSGELLPADRYEAWAEDARARAQSLFIALLKGAEEWDGVLAIDATDEEAHRALMRFHLDAGNRREAIRQFERLRHALREHIGVGPDPLTVALYEKALELEGPQPPTPAERAAALLANALVVWSRRDLAEAERLAREARAVALSAELSHEVGEASTLLALISYARGTWHDLFREQFADVVRRDSELEMAVLDAHLCFQEFYLYGPEGHAEAAGFAHELLETATRARSAAGEALATLLLGEFELLSGEIDAAAETLKQAVGHAQRAAYPSACSIALERLAETELGRGNKTQARSLLERARPFAESSPISSHLVVRVFGVQVCAADRMLDALKVAQDAERVLADAPRVCEPCSMNYRVEAARVFARSGDVSRAQRHVAEADRITGLWQGGPWKASVWEARAELRRAEGEKAQARALFLEAAEGFSQVRRRIDEARCREAAMAV